MVDVLMYFVYYKVNSIGRNEKRKSFTDIYRKYRG